MLSKNKVVTLLLTKVIPWLTFVGGVSFCFLAALLTKEYGVEGETYHLLYYPGMLLVCASGWFYVFMDINCES